MSKPGSAVPQRIMALFLSLAMALSLLVAGPRRVQEGMMPASLASSLGKVALSSVWGSLIWGLGEPSDLTATDAVASVFSTTGALTAGMPRAQAEKSIALVQELAAELDTLCHYTLDSSDDIKNMI